MIQSSNDFIFALTPAQANELLLACYVHGILPLPSPPVSAVQREAMGICREALKTALPSFHAESEAYVSILIPGVSKLS